MRRRERDFDDAEPLEPISPAPPDPPTGPPEPPALVLTRRGATVGLLLAVLTVVVLLAAGVGRKPGLGVGALHLARSVPMPAGVDDLPKTAPIVHAVPRVDEAAVERIARVIGIASRLQHDGKIVVVRDDKGDLSVQDDGTVWYSRYASPPLPSSTGTAATHPASRFAGLRSVADATDSFERLSVIDDARRWRVKRAMLPNTFTATPVLDGIDVVEAWSMTLSPNGVEQLNGRLVRYEPIGRVRLTSARTAFDTFAERNEEASNERIDRVGDQLVEWKTVEGNQVFVPAYAFFTHAYADGITTDPAPARVLALDDRAFARDESGVTTTTTVGSCAPSPSLTGIFCPQPGTRPTQLVPASDSFGFKGPG